jgi:hypothetical protein
MDAMVVQTIQNRKYTVINNSNNCVMVATIDDEFV